VDAGADFESAGEELAARIRRHGPLPYDEVIELALYHPVHGFYSRGGSAGRRRGDFITSPEVGPLFGAVLAQAFDAWWRELGEPDPFVIVDCGAGVGTLAKTVAVARPVCLVALTYVMVERSAALRAHHGDHLDLSAPHLAFGPHSATLAEDLAAAASVAGTGPRFVSLDSMPALSITGVVLANELLDNVPFKLVERAANGWQEVRVGVADDDRTLVDRTVPASDELAQLSARLVPDAPLGARLPIQTSATNWLRSTLAQVDRGRVVVIDYATTTAELAHRASDEWLRTYRDHDRGEDPLDHVGLQDITVDVCVDQLARIRRPDTDRSQAEFLQSHGIGQLVDEGKRIWSDRAHIGDLEAIRGRSRISEAEALSDQGGLGAFRVVEWRLSVG
jgi:SAM-dependent MidA family methyltransferase